MSSKNIDQGNDPSILLEKAINCIQTQDYKQSIEYFERLLSKTPLNPFFLHKCAEAYYFSKDYKQAQELNAKAIQQLNYQTENTNNITDKTNTESHIINAFWLALKLDEILSSSNRLFDTLEDLKKALEKHPTSRKDEIMKDMNRISQMYQSKCSFRVKKLKFFPL